MFPSPPATVVAVPGDDLALPTMAPAVVPWQHVPPEAHNTVMPAVIVAPLITLTTTSHGPDKTRACSYCVYISLSKQSESTSKTPRTFASAVTPTLMLPSEVSRITKSPGYICVAVLTSYSVIIGVPAHKIAFDGNTIPCGVLESLHCSYFFWRFAV